MKNMLRPLIAISATLSLRNTGTGGLTTNGDAVICFLIIPQ